jgi:oxaloacetate decarboxylase alpha subunit
VHTSIAPLANGPAQPATQTIARNLRGMGYGVDLDERLIDEVSEHFRRVAAQEGKPLGAPMEYTTRSISSTRFPAECSPTFI